MFDQVILMPEQEELLIKMVEMARSVPREEREKFLYLKYLNGPPLLLHPGAQPRELAAFEGDLDALVNEALLTLSFGSHGDPLYDISPRGFRYYEFLRQKAGQGTDQVEAAVMSYLTADDFRQRHPAAMSKWDRAANRLWSSDSAEELTTIGHLCREAVQDFADDLVEEHQPSGVTSDKSKTVARIRAVLDQQQSNLGETEKPFLDALLAYWGTVSDLIQRQEHGGQREGEPLIWEDGRRVVFQTAVVIFEIDRSLRRSL